MKHKIEYLEHFISNKGIQVNAKKIDSIKAWEPTCNVTQVQSFLGHCNYYRRFVKDFAKIASPLSDVNKKEIPFKWEQAQQDAFNTLKGLLTKTPILRCADPKLPYEVTCDASQTGLGAVVTQIDETGCRPVAFACRKLNEGEQNYKTNERELLAIIMLCRLGDRICMVLSSPYSRIITP